MQSLIPPPETLPSLIPADVVELEASPLVRIYASAGAHPLQWNQPRVSAEPLARLDPHAAGPVGVWYAATELATALAEVFQETRTVQGRPDRPRLCLTRVVRARLLDLSSDWSTRAGCGGLLGTAEHGQTQPWAAAIRTAFPDLDGLHWSSSVRPSGRNVVLWTQPDGRPPLEARPLLDRAVDDPAIAGVLLGETGEIGYRWAFPLPS